MAIHSIFMIAPVIQLDFGMAPLDKAPINGFNFSSKEFVENDSGSARADPRVYYPVFTTALSPGSRGNLSPDRSDFNDNSDSACIGAAGR
ncbi:MAG: hypothetical protein P4L55_22140 [Syntrophobacteraceae bacterium]|nr:hypothetical protein [Syntrophobacteraceae bacterium]